MAAPRFSDFLLKYPDAQRAPQALYLLGESQFQLKKWDAARATFDRFGDLHPFDELADEAELRTGQTYLEGGRPADAVKALQKFTEERHESPLLPEAIYWQSEASCASGDTASAEAGFRLLLQTSPGHQYAAWAGYKLGLLRETKGDTAAALAAYDVVRQSAPSSVPAASARYRAGTIRYARHEYDQARVLLDEVLQGKPPVDVKAKCTFLLGEIAFQQGAMKEAEERYRAVLAVDSIGDPAPQALFALGWLSGMQERWSDAALLRRAYSPLSKLVGRGRCSD